MITDTTLVLNTEIVKANIHKMVVKALSLNLELRPHFKTHQSRKVGRLFSDAGIKAATVSSLKMARYFASDGWNNITIAFPVNVLESDELDKLASEIDLRVLATNLTALQKLSAKLNNELGIYIELDPGYNRSGIPISNFEEIRGLKDYILNASNLRFEGFYTHAGHSYKCKSKKEVQALSGSILDNLNTLKEAFDDPICFGDTPSCSILDDFGAVDQISPGNFVFYDLTQVQIGSCKTSDIAFAVFCPVVAKYPERNELLIHGGAVHFSKDSLTDEYKKPFFGVVAENNNKGWGNSLPENRLISISQEHGIVACNSEYFNKVEIGDVIPILPIHSCLTADLMGEYFSISGEYFDHLNKKVFR
ncbi:MAG: alanine racemase [Balneolaceae bacterium]